MKIVQHHKNTLFYIGLISGSVALMYWVISLGTKLEDGRHIVSYVANKSAWAEFADGMVQNLQHPLALLLAQIVSIIFVARIFGWICRKIGQPTVVGEMIAGIVLGPSLLGLHFPELFDTLFPLHSLGNLEFLSLFGLILYMFVVGMELDFNVLKNKAHEAIVISHASIIIPFTLGVGLTYFIFEMFAPEGVRFLPFALFIGIAMSITAFPVLARIVQERGIHKTRLGTMVMTCAAADDITAWSLLAVVIAIAKAGTPISALFTIALAVLYVFLMLKVVRPFLERVGNLNKTKESMTKSIVGIFFLTLIISAYVTEVVGIHLLFGAFMAGAIMPNNVKFREVFIEKVEDVSMLILLPLFFVYTGLRTEIGLLNDPELWKVTAIIIVVAVIGKFIGSAIAAKYVKQSWKDSLTIGILMNTRGLVELVVLNIGYDLGILSPEIFAMLVIMALTTTFMTGPILNLINWIFKSRNDEVPQEISSASKYKILISFGNSKRGKTMLRLADSLTSKFNGNAVITAMHFSHGEHNQYNLNLYEERKFAPIIEESRSINREITTMFKVSANIDSDIVEVANKGEYDLLLIGLRQSIFEGSLLGKILGFTTRLINPENLINKITGRESFFEDSPFDERTRNIIGKSKVSVGILIDKGFTTPKSVFMPILSENDVPVLDYAKRLIHHSGSQIIVMDVLGHLENYSELKENLRAIEQRASNHLYQLTESTIDKKFLKTQNLMIVSLEGWKKLVDLQSWWLSDIPTTLILKN